MGKVRPRSRRREPVDPGLFGPGGVIPGPPRRCPDCGQPAPQPVLAGSEINFLCHRCGTCWHIGMGYLWAVRPPGERAAGTGPPG